MSIEDNESLRRKSVRGGALTLASQSIRFGLRVASQVVLARLLVPTDFGLIAMAAPFLGLLQLIADMGITQAVVQSRSLDKDQCDTLFWLSLIANFTVGFCLVASSPFISWLYGEPRLVIVSLVIGAIFPIAGLAAIPAAILNRRMDFGRLAFVEVTSPALALAIGIIAAKNNFGFASLLISSCCESIYISLSIIILAGWKPGAPRVTKTGLRLLKQGGHLTVFNLTQYVTTTADNIAVAFTGGASALGLYDKGYKLVTQPMAQLLSPASRVTLPLLSRMAGGNEEDFVRSYTSIVQLLMTVSTPFLLILMFNSNEIMRFVLGDKWDGVGPIVSWLCLGGLGSCLYTSTSWLFISLGKTKTQMYYGSLTSIISMTGFMAGLPWGPAGVAAGAGISFLLISTPLACFGATRASPITFVHLWFIVGPQIAAAALSASALYLGKDLAPQGAPITTAVLSILLFLVMILLSQSYRELLFRTWRLRRFFSLKTKAA